MPMYINYADVMVIGNEKPIYGFYDVCYDRSYLLFPMNATYDHRTSETCCFVVPGTTTPYSGVFYFERCHVKVGGEFLYPNTPITAGVKEGTVSYDFSTRTLTLNNATIETSDEVPISFLWQSDQKINLIGNNTITTSGSHVIMVDNEDYYSFYNDNTGVVPGRLTVTGDGTLTIDAEEANSGFFLLATKLYIENTTVDIVSKYGVIGYVGAFRKLLDDTFYLGNNVLETLTLDNCYFSYHNPEDFEDGTPLYYIDGLNLIDAKFKSPTDAYYDNGLLLWDGGLANTMVVVPNGSPTAIAPSTSVRQDALPWYTLSGQRIKKPTKPGIYIHGKKKMIID